MDKFKNQKVYSIVAIVIVLIGVFYFWQHSSTKNTAAKSKTTQVAGVKKSKIGKKKTAGQTTPVAPAAGTTTIPAAPSATINTPASAAPNATTSDTTAPDAAVQQ